MVFSIRQNATLPILKMKLIRDGRYDFKRFETIVEGMTITFSMKNKANGVYKVAGREGNLVMAYPCGDADGDINTTEYYICYQFRAEDTDKPGIYIGEFSLEFFDIVDGIQNFGKLIMPIQEDLEIHVIDSFIKTDVTVG
jgi:hypothetical protein